MNPPTAFQKMRANRAARALVAERARQKELRDMEAQLRLELFRTAWPSPPPLEPGDLGVLRADPPTPAPRSSVWPFRSAAQ